MIQDYIIPILSTMIIPGGVWLGNLHTRVTRMEAMDKRLENVEGMVKQLIDHLLEKK